MFISEHHLTMTKRHLMFILMSFIGKSLAMLKFMVCMAITKSDTAPFVVSQKCKKLTKKLLSLNT